MAIAVGGTEYVYGTCKYYTNTSSAMRYECRLAVTLNSQSTANNTSTATLVLQVRSTNSSYTTKNTQTSVINGTTMASGASFDMSNTNVWQTFASRTQTVTHNADGSYTFPVSASFTTNATTSAWSLKSGSVSGSVTLATIPRASSISCGSIALGSAGTITISTASSSFTHTITAAFGSTSTTVITKTSSTSVPWTPSLSWASQIPSATSGTCTLTCITYSGSTEVGRKAISISLTVPASVKPSLTSLTATRVDGSVPSAWATYVKGKSKVTLAISGAAGSYGSTIKGYSISGGGYSSTASSYTTGYLNTTGTITFTAYVTDSRGRKSDSKTVSITVYDYTAPTITAFTAFRCNSSGTADPSNGTYIKCSGSYSIASVNGKNSATTHATYYRAKGASSWTGARDLTSGSSVIIGSGNFAIATNYEVRLVVTDALGSSVDLIVLVSAAERVMNIGPHAVAFGMMSTASKRVESAWPMYVQGDRVAAIEYGTWTPILGNESVDEIPLTYTAQRGYYCRVGNLLHVSISINAAGAVTSYGDTRVYIRGLSFEPVYTESTGMISISGLASSYTSKAPGALGPYADYIVIMGNDMNSLRWNQFSDANKKLFYGAATYIVKW
ncbi:DUF859 family phage minor structural protein [Bianquea renquensis]|uniref:Pilus assembly protein n=1 Tax=Bianquea renquensis TaxID=2763661 RepID=A0A926DRJ6_9FIRM|nr:DUF859 family phage minor structural protein [Bianquea renquensis]MBC8542502.1 pilus assembly protein [Bianquea renquensis]